ncbi:helix-turn-helix transcriptional regulator [Actinoplanes sp. NPDC051494]|uniref:helix-turn-helix transcriptional regulator n=1 Tax=Actinoplanes sp. NPDC051494 TaxID=3363907 RepID=UPI003792C02A
MDATRELATFLRTRRRRLDPRDFGLPERRQARRTPGLRREEVAELAGISIDYVVRLEQARGLKPSADVVEALARALRLAPEERVYLFDLVQQRPRKTSGGGTGAEPSLARLVTDLSPLPAMLTNHRGDILAWNNEMTRLVADFGALPAARRNAMWLCLMHPPTRDLYIDRKRVVREGMAHLRAAWATHPEDETLSGLITELTADEELARRWAQGDVKVNGRGSKAMRHPTAGLIAVDFDTLTPLEDVDQRILICRAADDESRSALKRLFA